MKYEVLIIDGPYLAHRSYTAPYKLTTLEGRDSTMIHTFMNTLLSIKKTYQPETIAVAWESHGTPSWRRELSPTYKPSKGVDKNFLEQLADIKYILHLMGIKQFFAPQNEADDTIATLVHKTKKSVLIYTVDKDIMQLTNDENNVHILCGKKIMKEDDVIKKFKVLPHQIPEYLAMVGDKSDNIEGVSGIGKVKASNILKDYGSLSLVEEDVFKNKNDKEKALMNYKLTSLNYHANIQLLFKDQDINRTIEDILDKYELLVLKNRRDELRCN